MTRRQDEIAPVIAWLKAVRRRARTTLAAQRLLYTLTIALAVALGLGVFDYLVRAPEALRTLLLVVGLGAIAWAAWKYIGGGLRFCPSLPTLALRVESLRPDLKGRLASAVDFAEHRDREGAPDEPPITRGMETLALRDAAEHWSASAPPRLISARNLRRDALRLGLVAVVAVLLLLANAQLFSIGAARVLAPWSGAEWPKRTVVADATDLRVHPRTAAVPLRAGLEKTNRDVRETQVTAHYRLIDERGRAGPERTVLLTYQGREVALPRSERTLFAKGALFERLVEVDAPAVEYRFTTLDDQTPWRRIELVAPPAVASAEARIEPPSYAQEYADAQEDTGRQRGPMRAPSEIDLGVGSDERSLAPPALEGSLVALRLALNKPLPTPEQVDDAWLAATFGEEIAAHAPFFEARDSAWTLRWTLTESVRVPLRLVDEHGIESVEEAVFRFEAVADREPTATVTQPATDVFVLPTAVVPLEGEARDDVGLFAAWLSTQRATRAGGARPSGPGGALEPVGDAAQIASVRPSGALTAQIEASLDLREVGAQPGDEVWVSALAIDIRSSAGGAAAPVRSAVRTLRVISESEFIEQVREELSAVRAEAIRADEQQGEAQRRVAERGSDRASRRSQQLVAERIARQRESVDALRRRVTQNNLQDERLRELLEEADAALRRAGDASTEASGVLDEAAGAERERLAREGEQAPPAGDESVALDEAQAREAGAAQQAVRDNLTDLVAMLDAGEDTWVMRRSLEELLRAQRELRDQTSRVGADTAGAAPEDLTAQQRRDLQEIVRRQNELAEQTEELSQNLRERAESLGEQDPAGAAGMEQAARQLEQARVSQTQRGAASSASENRTSEAGQQQDQAAQDIQQALSEMEQGEQSRREQLRRMLASLMDSLRGLVTQQERELARLDAAEGDFAGLDAGMIRLNRNTLGVLDQANGAGVEVAPVARLVSRAADEQTQAIRALRAAPPDGEGARHAEQRSLEFLREALAEAQRIDDRREEQERREQRNALRAKYRDLLERQVALRERTGAFAGQGEALSRRDRFEVRTLGEAQLDIRGELNTIREETQGLAEARVFDFAHRRLDAETERAADALRRASVDEALPPEDRAIALLGGLVRAMEEAQQQSDFDEGGAAQGGGGGGGGQGGEQLILPIAELRLLRSMQADLALRTRAADAGGEAPTRGAVGAEQRELFDLGSELLERIRSQQQQGGGNVPGRPQPEPDGRPVEPAQPPNPLDAGASHIGADEPLNRGGASDEQ